MIPTVFLCSLFLFIFCFVPCEACQPTAHNSPRFYEVIEKTDADYFLRNQVRMRRLKREVGLETDQPKEIESSSESSDSESEDMVQKGKAVLLMKITQVEITQVEITQVGSRYELANLMLLSILVFIANFTLIFLLKRNPNRSIHSTMNRKYELVDRSRQAADV